MVPPFTWLVIQPWPLGVVGQAPMVFSTCEMRLSPPHSTSGWGQYLAQYLTIPVVNDAVAGRSARSYTDEGRFNTLINTVKPGDFVVIEFGHNDGTTGGAPDNGRQDAVGDGYNTTATVTAAK
jgi:lysophospholipase L1-like esterase